jgi:hypothetical protein
MIVMQSPMVRIFTVIALHSPRLRGLRSTSTKQVTMTFFMVAILPHASPALAKLNTASTTQVT